MARRELRDLLRRYRRAWRRRRRLLTGVLHWTRAGAVWAIDFAEPPLPIEGSYDRLLAVRDLSSGCQLLWLPVRDESAGTTCAAIEGLFREHGAPLVLKCDNGSPFIAEEMEAVLRHWGVWQLFSPVRLPRYNGSCEAGIGSMKTRTHHQAALGGHPGEWTCDDVEVARLQANQTARPWGLHGPVPQEVWQTRLPIRADERATFAEAVQQRQKEARAEQGYAAELSLGRLQQAAVNRKALRGALVACGLLRLTSQWPAGGA
jgi:transposase InsO family protein